MGMEEYVAKTAKRIEKLEKQKEALLAILEEIKQLELYTYDVDYDWDENPVDDYQFFEMEEFIDERLKNIPGIISKKKEKKK